jgi:hypothetical protein
MAGICRIYRRTSYGVRLIAQVSGGRVSGREAGKIRKLLRQCGFPHAPIEAVIDQLLLTNHDLGAAIIPDKNGKI